MLDSSKNHMHSRLCLIYNKEMPQNCADEGKNMILVTKELLLTPNSGIELSGQNFLLAFREKCYIFFKT